VAKSQLTASDAKLLEVAFRTAKQNARRLGALERRYLDPGREALGTMGHARPRSYRHAGWSGDNADGGDVVVRAGAYAIAECGQRRRRRE